MSVRLSLRIQRFDVSVVVAVAIGAVAVGLWMAARLEAASPPPDCLRGFLSPDGSIPAGCPDLETFLGLSGEAGRVMAAFIVVPVIVAVLPGSGLLSGEVERGTAQLAWTISPSRTRWLVERITVLALLVMGCAVAIAVVSEILEQAMSPLASSQSTFADYGFRGPVVLFRTFAFFGIALLVGGLTGRTVPALVLATGLCAALIVVLSFLRPYGQPLERLDVNNRLGDALTVGGRFVAPDGNLLTNQEAIARAPVGLSPQQVRDWVVDTFPSVAIGLSGDQLPVVELREGLLLTFVGAAAVAGTLIVVRRRRPY